ncbi:unnamed protein product [Didymodactylos carnosus]|uniref:Uncharacterized protein n=1 Tax=Didymodactylos carnosus TaxID=1234261 RepID=A0A815SA11_9BILA|nr:unnamed protein product [Didymodactylos carnosus]CAF4352984.1 unnamed protein product [Didymodactylos carnosus]CAF4441886.1 unnamed protein product [Didymodactylos carnosus]
MSDTHFRPKSPVVGIHFTHDCRKDIKYLFRDFDLKSQHVYDKHAAADILSKRSKYSSLLWECFEIDIVNLKNSY